MNPRIYTIDDGEGNEIEFEWDGPNDPSPSDLAQVVAQSRTSRPAPVKPAPQVAADEPGTWFGGAVKGFREGVLESPVGKVLEKVSDTFYSAPPIAASRGIAKAVIPQFVQEARLPTAKEARGLASSAAAGVAGGAAIAASPFSAGATLAALPAVAGAASAGTTALLGGDEDEITGNALLDAAGGAIPGIGRVASTGGRGLIRGAFGFKRGQGGEAIEESIRSGIGASSRGMTKARDIINRLSDEVTKTAELLDQGRITASTGLNNMTKVRQAASTQGASPEQLSAIDNLIDSYRQRFSGVYSTAAAHQQKRELYKPIEATFDARVPSHLNQAKQAFAGGFRSEVEREAEREGLGEFVAPVNRRIGNLLELEEQLGKQQQRGVGPIDAVLAVMSPKAEGARLAFMPAPRAAVGRVLARTGDIIGAVTDPYVQGSARLGGQNALGDRAEARARAAAQEGLERQRGIRDVARAQRAQVANQAFESANPVEPGRGAVNPVAEAFDRVNPVERPAENLGENWEDRAYREFVAEREAARQANAQAEAQLQLGRSQRRAAQDVLAEENPQQLVLGVNDRDPEQLLLGDQFTSYTPVPGQVPNRTGAFTERELPWRGSARAERVEGEMFPPERVTRNPGPTPGQLEAHRTRVPTGPVGPQGLSVIPTQPGAAIRLPSAAVDLPVQVRPGDAAFTEQPARQLAAGAGQDVSAAWARELGLEGDFGILTAANPGRTLSPQENAARNARLLEDLRAEGFTDIVPHRGVFGGSEEPSFLVRGLTPDVARRLGRAYGQVSVISKQGYHRLADNATFPSRGLNVGNFDDNFSEMILPDGRRVRYQMDFPEEAFGSPADVVGLSDGTNLDAAARYIDTDALLREADMLDAAEGMRVVDDSALGVNASGESAASMEALSRQAGMKARGEQFAVQGRDGRIRLLIGPDAVDYVARPGETFGVIRNRRFEPR